jgi:hypothetical protein
MHIPHSGRSRSLVVQLVPILCHKHYNYGGVAHLDSGRKCGHQTLLPERRVWPARLVQCMDHIHWFLIPEINADICRESVVASKIRTKWAESWKARHMWGQAGIFIICFCAADRDNADSYLGTRMNLCEKGLWHTIYGTRYAVHGASSAFTASMFMFNQSSCYSSHLSSSCHFINLGKSFDMIRG